MEDQDAPRLPLKVATDEALASFKDPSLEDCAVGYSFFWNQC